jgi:hypothetical protein
MTLRYTPDELVQVLKRTTLDTIVAEGGDDLQVLRDLEEKLTQQYGAVNFIVAGDKSTVLKAWQEKNQYTRAKIGFLADSDLWLFTEDRQQYPSVVFTDAYSIENLCMSSNSVIALVTSRLDSRCSWQSALNSLADWFSAEVAFFLNNLPCVLNVGIDRIIDVNANFGLTQYARDRIAEAPQQSFNAVQPLVAGDPLRFIRGKSLLLTLAYVMRRHDGNTMSINQLMRIGSRTENDALDTLIGDLSQVLANFGQIPPQN